MSTVESSASRFQPLTYNRLRAPSTEYRHHKPAITLFNLFANNNLMEEDAFGKKTFWNFQFKKAFITFSDTFHKKV